MTLNVGHRARRWIEVVLPLFSVALLVAYFHPQYIPPALGQSLFDSVMPWAIWGVIGALSGVLALSGLVVAFFLLYSPVYLLGRTSVLLGRKAWIDKRELRFYVGCFVLLCFLGGLAAWYPLVAAVVFVLLAGSAHLIWRILV